MTALPEDLPTNVALVRINDWMVYVPLSDDTDHAMTFLGPHNWYETGARFRLALTQHIMQFGSTVLGNDKVK
jgi:hypothetical protein